MAASRKRVLIVDDSKTTTEIIKVYLMGKGYDFSVASNGAEALAAMSRSMPDLVISDVNMPEMTGIELCQRVKRMAGGRDLPFVIITSKPDPETQRAALAAGADGCLTKPVQADKLAYLVSSLLDD